jgi:hypothetical protein
MWAPARPAPVLAAAHAGSHWLRSSLQLALLAALPLAAAPWSPVAFEMRPDEGYDSHGPCPATIGTIKYTETDCVQPKKGDGGEFLPAACSAGMGGLSFQGFAQCFSSRTTCWSTAGIMFGKLPPECNVGAVTTSHASFEANSGGVVCPGSPIIIAADGSMTLATVQPTGCWNLRLDGVGYRPFGLPFLLAFCFIAVAYVVGGEPSLRSHPRGGANKGNTMKKGSGEYTVVGESKALRQAEPERAEKGGERLKKDKKEKKQKEEKRPSKDRRPEAPPPAATAGDQVGAGGPVAAAAAGTASAGGGRWVHVPT